MADKSDKAGSRTCLPNSRANAGPVAGVAYLRARARRLDAKQNRRVLFWLTWREHDIAHHASGQLGTTDRKENLQKRWIERRYDAGATFGRLAVTLSLYAMRGLAIFLMVARRELASSSLEYTAPK